MENLPTTYDGKSTSSSSFPLIQVTLWSFPAPIAL